MVDIGELKMKMVSKGKMDGTALTLEGVDLSHLKYMREFRNAKLDKKFELDVKSSYLGTSVKFEFDCYTPIEEQIFKLCEIRDIPCDNDANFQILLQTKPQWKQRYAISDEDLMALQQGKNEVRLVHGNDFVCTMLTKITEASQATNGMEEMIKWTEALVRNCGITGPVGEWFVSEVILQKGIATLFDALKSLHNCGDKVLISKGAGLMVAAISQLLQFDIGTAWVEEQMALDVDEIDCLLCIVFGKLHIPHVPPKNNKLRDCSYAMNTRRLCASFLCTLMQQVKDVATVLHNAMMRHPDEESGSYYEILSDIHHEDPLYGIAVGLLLVLSDDAESKADVLHALVSIPNSAKLKKKVNAGTGTRKMLLEDMLLGSIISACADNERLELVGGGGGGGFGGGGGGFGEEKGSVDDPATLKSALKRMDERRRKIESDLRKSHQAMCKMADLIDVDNTLVNQSLRAIVRYGWDSIHWQKGYTCLHFAAECMDAPGVVELLALLAKDMNDRDATGKRPLDYARKEKKNGNVQVLERLRNQIYRQQQADKVVARGANDIETMRAQLDIPDNLTPTLRAGLEAVLQMGWKKIKWPNGFSALHLAAQCGSLEVVKLLLEGVNGVARDYKAKDKLGNTPLDYAKSSKHKDVADYLASFDPSTMAYKPPMDDLGMLTAEAHGGRTAGKRGKYEDEDRKPLEALPTAVPPEITDPKMRQMCKEVLDKGFGCMQDIPYANGVTALHYAAQIGDFAATRFLLKFGPNVTQKDSAGKTAKDYAEAGQHFKIIEALNQYLSDFGGLDGQDGGKIHKLMRELQNARDLIEELQYVREQQVDVVGDLQQMEARVVFMKEWINGHQAREIGPLFADQLETYAKQLELVGPSKLRDKLREGRMEGGMNLDKDEAALAVEQILFKEKKGAAEGIRQNILDSGLLVPHGHDAAAPPAASGKDAGGKKGASAKGAPPAGKGALPGKPGAPGKGGAPAPGGKGAPPGKGGKDGAPGKGDKGGKGGGKEKGGKDAAAAMRMPAITPEKPMKPLWWNRLIIDKGIAKDETIWDKIKDYTDVLLKKGSAILNDFVERFAKTAPKKVAGLDGGKKKGEEEEKRELRVITDTNKIVGKQGACSMLPDPEIIALGLTEFDETIIDKGMLESIKHNCIPEPAELKQMEKMRQDDPVTPWALPESYMWVVGHIPVYEARVNIWFFTRTYEERLTFYEDAYLQFEKVVDALRGSTAFREFLGLVLAAGNYLNGGTNRGQADGFEINDLPKLDTIKDNLNDTQKITHWVMRMFLDECPEFENARNKIVDELGPFFTNVKRRIAKSSDGVESLPKQVKYACEEFDALANGLKQELDKHSETMQMCLQFFEDPTDPMRTVLAEEIENAKVRVGEMLEKKKQCETKWKDLQKAYHLGTMASSELFMIIDDLFIPGDVLLRTNPNTRKKYMIPAFCGMVAPTLMAFKYLWGLADPAADERQAKKAPQRQRRRANKRKVDSDDDDDDDETDSD